MKIPLSKLKAMVLFFASNTDKRLLGKVKLMKLFYFADFGHIKEYGSPITWDTYVKLEHGPIPSGIKNIVDSVEDDIDNSFFSDIISIKKSEGDYLHRIVPLREFTEQDKKYFSESELLVMKNVCIRFADKNTKEIEEASHKEATWIETDLLEVIPYSLAAKDSDCKISKEDIDLMMKIYE